MSGKRTIQWVMVSFLLVAGVACEGVVPERRDVRNFAPFQTAAPQPTQFEDRGPQLSEAEKNVYEPIIDGFQKNHEALLRRADIVEQLERIENVYVQAGRYLDLYAIYQKDVKAHGLESPAAERLAWGHIRLGQQQAARELIEDLVAGKGSATAYFLSGAYFMQWDGSTPEGQDQAAKAWKKTVELDPRFRGFEGITASMLNEQVVRLDAMLAANPPKPAPASTTPVAAAAAVVEAAAKVPVPVEVPVEAGAAAEVVEPVAEVVEPVAVAPVEPVEAPKPAMDLETQYRVAVARGELLAAEGNLKAAEDAFLIAKTFKADGVEAELGQLRAGWGLESARVEVARRMRLLSQRNDLTARQVYDIGLFAFSKMDDRAFAREMLTRVKTMDPALAAQLQVDQLLSRLQ
jgi:hypothetical protein